MIKKIFISLLSIVGLGLSFTSAYNCTSNGTACWDMEFGQGNNSAGYKGIVIDHNFNFSGNVFEINSLKSSVSTRFLSYWWQSDGLYYTKQNWNNSNQLNGKIDGFYVCNSQPQTSENVYLLSQINSCTYNLGFTNFGNYIKTFDLYGRHEIVSVSKSNVILCMYSSEGSSYICIDTSSTSNNNGSFLSTSSINQVAINSPFVSGGNDGGIITGGIELNSTESALEYFENYYGWNKNICYVGIDNITTLWGSSVSFEEGTGLDIFQVFEGLYGNSDLYKMYPWLNSWIINYTQRNLPSEDRLYLANYNSGTNQVDLYYDNLTFPFTGKPVALYFMADEVSYFTNNQTMGSDVVSYCYIKLKGGTFEDIIDNSTKQSITQYTEKYNTHLGLNPDGSNKIIDYSQFGNFEGELPFSGNTSVSNTLKNFFDKINDQISGISISTTFQILPSWIVSALLIVVLFRIIRKK